MVGYEAYDGDLDGEDEDDQDDAELFYYDVICTTTMTPQSCSPL